jgi:hypothetical protein
VPSPPIRRPRTLAHLANLSGPASPHYPTREYRVSMSSTSTMRAKARFFDAHGQFRSNAIALLYKLHTCHMKPVTHLDSTINTISSSACPPPAPPCRHLPTSSAREPRVRNHAQDPGRPITTQSSPIIPRPLHPIRFTIARSSSPHSDNAVPPPTSPSCWKTCASARAL